MLLVGVDPGTTTGVASWDTRAGALLTVASMSILHAMRWIIEDAVIQAEPRGGLLVVWEDCRSHRLPRHLQTNQSREQAQGVGSVKRDCSIWQEFLTDARLPNITRAPSRRRTKLDRVQFRAATGWDKPSNEHGRDAAMLVANVTDPMAQAWLAQAPQRFQTEGRRA